MPVKQECLRPASPASLDESLRLVSSHVDHDKSVRLHSALGYITSGDKLNGLEKVICAERDGKLEESRELRRQAHQPAQ